MTDREPVVTVTPTCATCRFWKAIDGSDGDCRRHAPRTIEVSLYDNQSRRRAEWALTYKDEWCGEHQPRAAAGEAVAADPQTHADGGRAE